MNQIADWKFADRLVKGGLDHRVRRPALTDPAVKLHPAHIGQIVAIRRKKQVMQQALSRVLGGRFAGTHHPVNFDLGVPLAAARIRPQGVGDVGAAIDLIDIDDLEFANAASLKFLQRSQRQDLIGLRQHFAGLRVR
jgi:hypothetical protein